jgi:hypothetical protein
MNALEAQFHPVLLARRDPQRAGSTGSSATTRTAAGLIRRALHPARQRPGELALPADAPKSYLVADLNNDDVFETGIVLSNVTSLSALQPDQIV